MFHWMAHDGVTEEVREQLSLYVLDMLDDEDARLVARHLSGGCTVCAEEIREIRNTISLAASTTTLLQPPPSLRARVLAAVQRESALATGDPAQIWKRWTAPQHGDLHVVRREEGEWETVAPGVTARQLYVDREHDAVTMMVRMEPGASYASHRHAGPEQCFVLEGDLCDGAQTFHAGDFQCAARGSTHDVQSTEGGCLLLILSSLHDELLH